MHYRKATPITLRDTAPKVVARPALKPLKVAAQGSLKPLKVEGRRG